MPKGSLSGFSLSQNPILSKVLSFVIIFLAVFYVFDAKASISEPVSITQSITNTLPIPIPANMSVSISISHSTSGKLNILSPSGITNVVNVSGNSYTTDITLSEAGTYIINESYNLVITGTHPYGAPVKVTKSASGAWTYTNPAPGIGRLKISSSVSAAVTNVSGPIAVSLSGNSLPTSANVRTTAPVLPGNSVSATISGTWTVDSSMSSAPVQPGTIQVTTNKSQATYTITGPVTYTGSGQYWSVTSAPVGQYTIVYGDITGYQKPPAETKTLTSGGSILFSGTYQATPATGTIQVNTNLNSATFAISGPESYNGGGKNWLQTEAPTGEYTITFSDVDGYITPSPQTKTLTGGNIVTFIGLYRSLYAGTIEVNTNLAQATFSIAGPANYTGGGKFWSETDVPVGEYTISYNSVSGYITPPSETKSLVAGEIISFTGIYEGTGTIEVYTNLAQASFSISGPASYTGGGKSWVKTGALAGEYTITYNDVNGYKTPSPEKKTLAPGDTITFICSYKSLIPGTGTLEVISNLDQASFSISGPASYTGSGKFWSESGAPIGQYTITYNSISGYRTPPSETKILGEGETIVFNAIYRIAISSTGTIEVYTNLDEAGFKLVGPTIYTGKGRSWVEEEAPIGEYTITYDNVPDFETPLSETKILTEGGRITFMGAYDNIALRPKIKKVMVVGSPAGRGGVIRITVIADPGCKVTFSIEGALSGNLAELPNLPGTYVTSFNVPNSVEAINVPLKITATNAFGFTATDSSQRVTIDTLARILKVKLSNRFPALGETVTVMVLAESKAFVGFVIKGVFNGQMEESRSLPGTYTASFTVVRKIPAMYIPVEVKLIDAFGNVAIHSSTKFNVPPWDVNTDGVVDILDLKAVIVDIGKNINELADVNIDGFVDVLDVVIVGKHFGNKYIQSMAPAKIDYQNSLLQNYPNPCNPGTWIPFTLAKGNEVTITIYNSGGRLVRHLDLGYRQAGIYAGGDKSAYWDGANDYGEQVASGVYFYHIKAGDFSSIRKMLVAK